MAEDPAWLITAAPARSARGRGRTLLLAQAVRSHRRTLACFLPRCPPFITCLPGDPRRHGDDLLLVVRPVCVRVQHAVGMTLGPPEPLKVRQRTRLDPARCHPDKRLPSRPPPDPRGMAAADPADGNPGMSYRSFLVSGQQCRGGSGRGRHAAKSGSCESYRPGGLTTALRSALSPPRRPPATALRTRRAPRVPAARRVPAGRGDRRSRRRPGPSTGSGRPGWRPAAAARPRSGRRCGTRRACTTGWWQRPASRRSCGRRRPGRA